MELPATPPEVAITTEPHVGSVPTGAGCSSTAVVPCVHNAASPRNWGSARMARYPDAQSKEDDGRPVLEANGTGAPDLPTPHGKTAPVSRPRPHRRLLHRCRSRAKLALADFCADRFFDAANGERPRP